jgi:hypothetical protein
VFQLLNLLARCPHRPTEQHDQTGVQRQRQQKKPGPQPDVGERRGFPGLSFGLFCQVAMLVVGRRQNRRKEGQGDCRRASGAVALSY